MNYLKKFILYVYQIFLWLPLVIVITLLVSIITIVGCCIGFHKFFSYYPGWLWSRFLCIITFCKVKVVGREKVKKNQSYVFISNHQGIYDCWLIFGYLNIPIKWVMKKNLRKIPFVGIACEISEFIFVDYSSPIAASKTIEEAQKKLKQGSSIVMFPEGSRTKTGKLGYFKKGAFKIAMNLKLPIIPITINGSYEVMSRHTYLIHPHKMEIIIHDPIIPKQLSSDSICILSNQSKEIIKSALWEQYK